MAQDNGQEFFIYVPVPGAAEGSIQQAEQVNEQGFRPDGEHWVRIALLGSVVVYAHLWGQKDETVFV
ncbi:hypothetical protein EI42_06087 [Thermosporothrix hazakensis]|jgi:hypothetical protein|uniref:Uncharacterized protein n=2 Tax=Thermosporothrix TaxID=768650 RepID=A0A326TSV2_THEHA|nr:hypothetical protein [Thermosporothrix hazakensis]PZW19391.1 hypothetical protein EI42_06087 [Thermosporothrix hazakensis]